MVIEYSYINFKLLIFFVIFESLLIWGFYTSPNITISATAFISLFVISVIYPQLVLGFIINGIFLVNLLGRKTGVSQLVTPVVELICLNGLIFSVLHRHKGWNLRMGPIIWIVLLIGLLLLMGCTYSSSLSYGLQKTIKYFTFNLFLFFSVMFFVDDLGKIESLLGIIVVFGLTLAILSFFVIATKGLTGIGRFVYLDNPIWYSRTLGISIISIFFLLSLSQRKFIKIVLITLVPLLLFLMFLSASRGPLLALVLSLFFFISFFPELTSRKKLLLLGGIVGTVVLVLLLTPQKMTFRILNIGTVQDITALYRLTAWRLALRAFWTSPLLGIGTGSFFAVSRGILHYPHNIFLELACEAGVVGVVLFTLFTYCTFKYGIRMIQQWQTFELRSKMAVTIITIYIFAFINAMVSGDITTNQMLWFSSGAMWTLYISDPYLKGKTKKG